MFWGSRTLRSEHSDALHGAMTPGVTLAMCMLSHWSWDPAIYHPPTQAPWPSHQSTRLGCTTAPILAPRPQLWLAAHSRLRSLPPDKCSTSVLHSTPWHSPWPTGAGHIPERQVCWPVALTQYYTDNCVQDNHSSNLGECLTCICITLIDQSMSYQVLQQNVKVKCT